MQLYRTLFQQSWLITKRHKLLWFFGFFALFFGGKGLDIELFFTNAKLIGSHASPFQPTFWEQKNWTTVLDLFGWRASVLIASLLLLGLLALAVMMISQIGLVDAFGRYARAKKSATIYTVDHALQATREHFFPVLGVNVLGRLVVYGLLAVVASPLFFGRYNTSHFTSTVVLFFVLMPIAVVVSLVVKYAVNFMVLKDYTFREALRSAWQLFRRNIGLSIEMAVVMSMAFFVANVVGIVVGVLVTMPLLLLAMVSALLFQSVAMVALYYFAVYFAIVVGLVVTAIIFSAWHFGNWTLLFLELTKEDKRSTIHRLFRGEKITGIS
ncbi:MAG: hypothetical protein HYV32_02340 [Candidatus Kerfeldbacteria bacterium]|nr:hypothetical protein [Candidatus Kerfeldbacteria bacterium]